MSLNNTPSANRIHIGFFGCRNAGKSSLVNAVTDQDLAVVSDIKGTTTDPVTKAMELLPLGPVVIIDTPGFDDVGVLGEKRVQKTKQILNRTDIAVLVVDAAVGMGEADRELFSVIKEKKIPCLLAYNKADVLGEEAKSRFFEGRSVCSDAEVEQSEQQLGQPERKEQAANGADCVSVERQEVGASDDKVGVLQILVSAQTKENIHELKERLAHMVSFADQEKKLVGDLLQPGDFVVLVIPVDESAPKGRLILPQQQVIRDILDTGAIAISTKETELAHTLENLGKRPALVITDSQVFGMVSKIVPREIPLTSFSILMARYKGFLETAVRGAAVLDKLSGKDKVLLAEGCTHHRQCNDIGTVKLPRWLRQHAGAEISIETCSGTEFPEDLSEFSLVIHCGGCMLNEREIQYRMKCATDQGIPFTNYGTAIAHMNGILERSLAVIPK